MPLIFEKSRARLQAKMIRAQAVDSGAAAELIAHFPAARFRGLSVAGFWPIGDEIDVRPLMGAVHGAGATLYLPAIKRKAHPLMFRRYAPGDRLIVGAHGTREPVKTAALGRPDVVLMPLLAFTGRGDRLGYGGGYYDRTLAHLRESGNVFACGVAYGAQKAAFLPTDTHDMRLDGVLTETGFKDFT